MSAKRSGKDGTFGAPKPLPGQPGYNMSESDRLDKDTRDMEVRLLMLQEKMKQQNQEMDRSRPAGGTKWKSARADKGSVAQYGKEVREKAKERLGKSNTNLLTGKPSFNMLGDSFGQSSATQEKENLQSGGTDAPSDPREYSPQFTAKEVAQWTTLDVGDWLSSLQLNQYVDSFAQNEIDGKTLVDLTLEDLDYLNVTALAHRKALFREVETLRAKCAQSSVSSDPPRELLPSHSASRISVTTHVTGDARIGNSTKSADASSEVAPPKRTHWSQLQPLTDQAPRSGIGASSTSLVNAADAADMLDEEAERRAFQEAVMEWRRQDAAGAVVREHEVPAQASSDMWVNPFAPSPPSRDAAPTQGRSLAGQPGDLLDEEAEHAEFVKAVEAWRLTRNGGGASGGKGPAGSRGSTSTGLQAGDDLPPPPPTSTASNLAATLAAALDQEQQHLQRQLEIQRRQAEQRLAIASADLNRMRQELAVERMREEQARSLQDMDREESETQEEKHDQGERRVGSRRSAEWDADCSFDDSMHSEPEEYATSYSPTRRPLPEQITSTVRVALLSSELGQLTGADSTGCVIEYATSEDED